MKGWFAPKAPGQHPVDQFRRIKDSPHIELNNQLFPPLGVQVK
jgi:hypothetical protein